MNDTPLILAGIVLLAAGTYLMRFAGYKLGGRLPLSERLRTLLSDAAIVLLLAVAAISAIYDGQVYGGGAKVLGVLFAMFLAWKKAPLIVIIVSAALVTAVLRLLGMA